MGKDPSGGVPSDQQAIADNAIGSAQVAQEGADFGKAAGYAEPAINNMVENTVDYAQTNTDPATLGGAEIPE